MKEVPAPIRVGGSNLVKVVPAEQSQKQLISQLLVLLRKAEAFQKEGTSYRRSSLGLDSSKLAPWFDEASALRTWKKEKGGSASPDEKKLYDEIEYCRTNDVDFARKLLAGLILKYPALLGKYAARSLKVGSEEFRYYHHAQMVVNQFLDYFLDDEGPGNGVISNELMIWMILFHDMDKVLSIETFGNDGEHDATVDAMKKYGAKDSGFSEKEITAAWRMVSMDPLGEYFKGAHALMGELEKKNKMAEASLRRFEEGHPLRDKIKISEPSEQQLVFQAELVAHCIEQIVDTAALAGFKGSYSQLPGWFQRNLQFYQCDFSSYHVDAKYGDKCFYDAVSSDGRIDGPNSFNPPYFGEPDVDQGDATKCLIETKASVGSGKRLAFRLTAHEKAAERLVDAFSSGVAQSPTLEAQDPFEVTKALRAALVESRAAMKERTAVIPVVDFRKVLNADKRPTLEELEAMLEGVELPPEEDVVLDQFEEYGLFIRKLVPIPDDKTPREDLENGEFWKLAEKVVKESVTPWVLPATLVLKGIPTNLTNAGVELLHSSGFLYDMDTPMAPSTKEHSESAQLATKLNATIQRRIKDGFGHDKWLGIVRATVEVKGGKTYEDRKSLVMKLREMELRRSGRSPDLSTKELLHDVLLKCGRPILCVETFPHALAYWESVHNKDTPLEELIVDQLRGRYEKTLEELGSEKYHELGHVLDKLRKVRAKRDHTIYDGSDRSLKTGNRYYVEKKGEQTEMGSSEADGYDGYTFKTNEVLLLPDGYHRIIGVYVNPHSLESLVHSLNLAKEIHAQTGRQFGLYTYSASDRENRLGVMNRVSVKQILGRVLRQLGRGESIKAKPFAAEAQAASVDAPKDEGTAELSMEDKIEVLNAFLAAHNQHLPDATPAKDRG